MSLRILLRLRMFQGPNLLSQKLQAATQLGEHALNALIKVPVFVQ